MISRLDSPDIEDNERTVRESARVDEFERFDWGYEVQALAGGLEGLQGSLNGKALTGVVAAAQGFRVAQLREKDGAGRAIWAHMILMQALADIDARIAQLEADIATFEELRQEVLARSDEHFERMHELEDALGEISERELTDAKRAELKRLIGAEADDISDDEALLDLARLRIETERQGGQDASAEAERLRHDIEARILARDALVEERQQIINDHHTTPEQKANRAAEAIERSFKVMPHAESANPHIEDRLNLTADRDGGAQRSSLGAADDFEFDEAISLDEDSPPTLLQPR